MPITVSNNLAAFTALALRFRITGFEVGTPLRPRHPVEKCSRDVAPSLSLVSNVQRLFRGNESPRKETETGDCFFRLTSAFLFSEGQLVGLEGEYPSPKAIDRFVAGCLGEAEHFELAAGF